MQPIPWSQVAGLAVIGATAVGVAWAFAWAVVWAFRTAVGDDCAKLDAKINRGCRQTDGKI